MAGMDKLDHRTAVVIIPPEDIWSPIQAIREKHDSKVGRWMPHITLIYPFLPRSRFQAAANELASACKAVKPFDVKLARFDHFSHGKGYFTLWLGPDPAEPIKDLHATLCPPVYEDGYDLDHAIWHFTPHLSVGQARGMANMVHLLEELQAGWSPLSFRVDSIQLIWRNDRPDDAFRVDRSLRLEGR
jgi:2'-5' RNA ligase